MSKFDDAEKHFINALGIYPEYANSRNGIAMLYLNTGRANDAIAILEKLIKDYPKNHFFYNNTGLCYDFSREYQKAVLNYKKAIELKSDYSDAYNNLGVTYGKTKQYDLARENFLKSLEYNSNFCEAFNNLGIISELRGDYDTSRNYYKRAILINPNYQEALANFARLSKEIKK
jgi:tetratricopeptide (TPR) repeat protein